jgi:hypothetical protein
MRLGKDDQRALALWAADCAEHVLRCFEDECPQDDRLRDAIEAARAWARGAISVGEARAAADTARAAAAREREWQLRRLREHLRPAVSPAGRDD